MGASRVGRFADETVLEASVSSYARDDSAVLLPLLSAPLEGYAAAHSPALPGSARKAPVARNSSRARSKSCCVCCAEARSDFA
jgi:hypothetical protein